MEFKNLSRRRKGKRDTGGLKDRLPYRVEEKSRGKGDGCRREGAFNWDFVGGLDKAIGVGGAGDDLEGTACRN